ncbi:alpha/beta hydrolase [Microbacterium caowuchunii]|uniref:Alpha/beta hydrolase n=1 Tax=Microbacterium caowuchunii TaxID=2614638 RepID=A0A5N0TFE8_9MICO|nr:alpha/beta hydrolase [Microbacterium caowuchunii]KAA9133782.1 alpha/beta hydrolase [Microbacterium caowuchunii]
MSDGWGPDILGAGFEQRTLPLVQPGENGPLVATLVRSAPNPLVAWTKPLRDVDVLYVHGWSDYFFQRELARFWTDLGARFYALDLHRYGRSTLPGEVPGYADSLEEYDEDIELALAAMGQGEKRGRRLVLVGHSTGGLTLSLWAARHPGRASALVLNSPWLELQIGPLARQAIAPLVLARARFQPLGQHPVVDLGFYTRAQIELGAIPTPEYREPWRPAQGFPTHPGWFNAVLTGHATVAAGIDVGCPALVLLSARSSSPLRWVPAMTETDSVLVVDEIARAALRLGPLVTVARIPGAIHDVFLSASAPREHAFAVTRDWTAARFR